MGDSNAYLEDKILESDVPAQMINGQLMVPLRMIANAAMCKVDFDSDANIVYLSSGSRLMQMKMGGGYDDFAKRVYPSPWESMPDYCDLYAADSQEIAAACFFTDKVENTIVFYWYHYIDGKNKELVSEDYSTAFYSPLTHSNLGETSNYTAVSVLPNTKFKIGKWHLAVKIGGTLSQEKDFVIEDYTGIYGEMPWQNGVYSGYFSQYKEPSGYGELKLESGTNVIGDFSIFDDLDAICSDGFRGGINPPDKIMSAYISGSWTYSDGCRFVGTLFPYVKALSKADLDSNNYEFCYDVKGTFTDSNGSSKNIEGHYPGFDPSYRFDSIAMEAGNVHSFY